MGAARVRQVGRLEVARDLEPRIVARSGGREGSRRGEPREVHAPLRPAPVEEGASVLLHLVFGYAEDARGDPEDAGAEVTGGEGHRV